MNDNKIAHLQMIQNALDRMATVSFGIRGWALTLVAGFFALVDKTLDWRFYLVAFIPIIAFWLLDGFYLALERSFAELFETVRVKDEADIDFSMKRTKHWTQWPRACFATPLLVFYIVLIASTIGLICILPSVASNGTG